MVRGTVALSHRPVRGPRRVHGGAFTSKLGDITYQTIKLQAKITSGMSEAVQHRKAPCAASCRESMPAAASFPANFCDSNEYTSGAGASLRRRQRHYFGAQTYPWPPYLSRLLASISTPVARGRIHRWRTTMPSAKLDRTGGQTLKP